VWELIATDMPAHPNVINKSRDAISFIQLFVNCILSTNLAKALPVGCRLAATIASLVWQRDNSRVEQIFAPLS
jgi:hypothetical protein